ncbi:MAG: methyltransferase domain-containing protein [Clostridiales bacterium]|nr:methyltransferase domain-containing protein [Clostridiales bacterium]
MSMFDNEASTYDSWYKTKLGSFVDLVESQCAFELLDLPKGSKILDVGCGSGNFSIKLAKMGFKVTGIDLSVDMLKVAREKAKSENVEIDFLQMNVYDLKFENQSFDGVFSMAAFEFIPDSSRALDEMMRVLKIGGQLIIGTIHKESAWGKMYLSVEMQENSVFKHANLKTMEEMKMFFTKNLVDSKECLFIPPVIDEDKISMEMDQLLKTEGNRGGFICLKWIK